MRAGVYRAVLARDGPNENDDYLFLAVSQSFLVVEDPAECPENNNNNVDNGDDNVDESIMGDNTDTNGDSEVDATPAVPEEEGNDNPSSEPPQTTTTTASTTTTSTAPTTATPTTAANATAAPGATIAPAGTSKMSLVIAHAKTDILAKIQEIPVLKAQYLRMIFHDCVGGVCDGCINVENPDNGGLGLAMNSLRDIATKYKADGLSRADIYVLASYMGVEWSMPADDDSIDMPFRHYGRIDCDDRPDRGPDPPLCSPDLGTDGVLEFFAREFDMDARETACIMGAHTM